MIVDFCNWQDLDFAKYNALPDKGIPITNRKHWNTENEAWLKVIEGLKRVLSKPCLKRSTEPVTEKSRLMDIRTHLFERTSEIVKIITPLFERLKAMKLLAMNL